MSFETCAICAVGTPCFEHRRRVGGSPLDAIREEAEKLLGDLSDFVTGRTREYKPMGLCARSAYLIRSLLDQLQEQAQEIARLKDCQPTDQPTDASGEGRILLNAAVMTDRPDAREPEMEKELRDRATALLSIQNDDVALWTEGEQNEAGYVLEGLLLVLADRLQERERLLGPEGQICPQDGGVCWDGCNTSFCALQAARDQLSAAEASLAAQAQTIQQVCEAMRAAVDCTWDDIDDIDLQVGRWADQLSALTASCRLSGSDQFERAWNDARAQRDEWQEKFDVAEASLTTQAQTIQRVIERWNREADDLYHRVARLENPNGPSGNSMRTAALRLRLCAQQLSDLATSVVSERPEQGDRREG